MARGKGRRGMTTYGGGLGVAALDITGVAVAGGHGGGGCCAAGGGDDARSDGKDEGGCTDEHDEWVMWGVDRREERERIRRRCDLGGGLDMANRRDFIREGG